MNEAVIVKLIVVPKQMQTTRSADARLIVVNHDPLQSIFKGSVRITMIMSLFNKEPTPETAVLDVMEVS